MATETLNTFTPGKPSYPNSISKVRVIARVRPFLPHEIPSKNPNSISCISVLDQGFDRSPSEVTVHLKDPETSRNECYQLDSFFGQEDNNVSLIFNKEVEPLIPGILHGCNATVFAYGATGSGKTYTMQGTDEDPGLMPLTMSKILSFCESTESVAEISYYEVYLDRCYDLLELKPKEIAILDDKDGQINLKGLSKVPVTSMFEFYETFSCGIQRRKIAHTGLNDVSSRSHAVLVVSVSSPCSDGSGVVTGKLNLIDLAGNEDNRRTCNEGIRLQESAKINQSLFALSNVIYALNKNLPRVPYRDSKLTRILQDSLGGTSRALMIACLNPGDYQESVHTVSLASRSRHISNIVSSAHKQETPKVKIDMEAKLKAWLESRGKSRSVQKLGAFGSTFLAKTPSSVKVKTNQSASNAKQRTISAAVRNLLKNEGPVDDCLQRVDLTAELNKEENTERGPDENLSKNASQSVESSAIRKKENALQSPSRKALHPINGNQKPQDEISSMDQLHPILFEPKTPKTPFVLNYDNKEFKAISSMPLDKFSARSSTLKNCLVQEYIDFLNTANREELLELKGIGVKLADYILELRETSPLKSLNDMEKIGLSSKQIHNLFSRAARGIFERAEEEGTAFPSSATIQEKKMTPTL